MNASSLPIIIGCLVALVTAVGVVLSRRPVHGAVALLGHSLAIAGLYLMLGADLVAMGQLIVYSGAIVVLFLFVVLLLPTQGDEGAAGGSRAATAAIGFGATLLALAAATSFIIPRAGGQSIGVADVARALFGSLVVPFELTAPLLLVAIVGAVTIWRRQEHQSGGRG